MKRDDLLLYRYLSSFCWDEYYFPMDGPYQNYTYFPKASLGEVRDCWRRTLRLVRSGRAPKDVGLYVHWPFCPSQCTFCFCSMAVPSGADEMTSYAAALKAEMDAFKDVFRGAALSSVWLGGGTPTFMPAELLDGLLGHVRSRFRLRPDAQFYIEASPATLTPEKADLLLRHGVNRITLGVQTVDDRVLAGVRRRGQTRAAAEKALGLVRGRGMLVDLDLMMGLEGQTNKDFVKDLSWALRRRPDVLHLFAFEPRAQTRFARDGKRHTPERRKELRALMELADRAVRAAGYRTSRLDPDTLEPDCPEERQDSAVRRHGASVLGIGHSAVSHAFGSAWYCHPLAGDRPSRAAARKGRVPDFRLMRTGPDEEMRGCALRSLSLFGRIQRRDFRRRFGRDVMRAPGLSKALRDLEAAGLVRADGEAVSYVGEDPVEKNVCLKHLYSGRVLRALMKGRGAELKRFSRRNGGDGWPPVLREKMGARSLFRVYFR